MSGFNELNTNINTILTTLLSSQNLCKYLYYNADPLSQPDLADTSILLMENIFPKPVVPLLTDTAKSQISIILDDFNLTTDNTAIRTSKVNFYVYCHLDLWVVPETLIVRPYSILYEIDRLFNQKRIITIGKLDFLSCKWIPAINGRQGFYKLSYKCYDFN